MRSRLLLSAAIMAVASFSFGQITRNQMYTNLHRPVGIVQPPGVTTQMYVIEQRGLGTGGTVFRPLSTTSGRISLWNPSTGAEIGTFLTVSPVQTGSEDGLLGLAFHPNHAQNGFLYVNFTYTVSGSRHTEIRRYTRSTSNPNIADPASALVIMRIQQPFSNHNGGTLRFGSDGCLYIGMGDGGSANDPGGRAQNMQTLLGKMLRIDVDGDDFPADSLKNYRIPTDNPFFGSIPGLDEIWSLGLRNPWKWDFDYSRRNGYRGMTIADVGQDTMEEVSYERGGQGGLNYGWNTYEGTFEPGYPNAVPIANPKLPFLTYNRAAGFSISGGTVYRGTNLGTTSWGNYFVGDYGGWITWLPLTFHHEDGGLQNSLLAIISSSFTPKFTLTVPLVSVESDNNGELWIAQQPFPNNPNYGSVSRLDRTGGASRAASGNLALGDLAGPYGPVGVPVEIRMNANPSSVTVLQVGLSQDGSFRIPVPTGAGRLSVNYGSWLRRTVAFDTTAGNATSVQINLVNGDVDESGEIDAADIDVVIGYFGLAFGEPTYVANRNSDLDRSGEVDAADIDIVISNFGGVDDAP